MSTRWKRVRRTAHPFGNLLRLYRAQVRPESDARDPSSQADGGVMAACWAHVRRKFYDMQVAHKSAVATEALERIAALYAIEKEIHGR